MGAERENNMPRVDAIFSRAGRTIFAGLITAITFSSFIASGMALGELGKGVPVSYALPATPGQTLPRGWNQVMLRGYCVGYPPFRAGLILSGPTEKLWTLKLSAQPPAPE